MAIQHMDRIEATREWAALQRRVAGRLILPSDADYDGARAVWNGSIDRHPAVIARCAGVDDVVAALGFARTAGLTVAVRGGGHNIAGTAVCDGGMVIDLSSMKEFRVDPVARTAWAGPGLTWGEFDAATQASGLAAPGGVVSSTGIAGLTLGGGGAGWLMRKHGATCDNLLSADVVTADGRMVHASHTEHPDLFWGLRGGGGNFGIVTSFEFRLHPVGPTVLGGFRFYPLERAADVLGAWREFGPTVPDELTTIAILRKAPAAPVLPAELHGAPVIVLAACYTGPVDEGRAVLAPLDALGPPLVDLIAPRPFLELQTMSDASWTAGFQNYWKSEYLARLDDAAIGVLVRAAAEITSPLSDIKIAALGGALSRVDEDATAFGNRSASFLFNINARWVDPAESKTHVRWTRKLWHAVQPASTGGVYVNFLGDDDAGRTRAAYGDAKHHRLRALKAAWDPTNCFCHNQNIPPAAVS